jgi:hypothetical protein
MMQPFLVPIFFVIGFATCIRAPITSRMRTASRWVS